MNFKVEKKEKHLLITSQVEKLDGTVSPELKSEFVMANASGFKNIVLDLGQTRYCDSSGLSAVLIGNRLCKKDNGSLVLCGLNPSVQKLVTISQLDAILNVAPTLSEAVDMLFMDEVMRDVDGEEQAS